jgi:DNA primase
MGFLAGYFAADGHVAKDGTVMLNSASRVHLQWVREVATQLGIATYGITTTLRKGLATEPTPLHRIHFVPSTLDPGFFLLAQAKERFSASRKAFARLRWRVVSVEPATEAEEVFCAEVPGTHAFALEDNILTGNCFGCGAHGTAIRFVMEYENLGFVEAIETLAASLGLEVPNERGPAGGQTRSRSEALRPLLDAAAAFYRQKLKDTPRAIDYLKRRGLTGQIAKRFGLGYAPEGWDALASVFTDYRGNADLIEAGLVVAGEAGKRHDRFRDRIMFPITDGAGRMIGFGGRILDRGEPKYLNSPETPLFSKGRELFGLWPAKDAMKRENRAIVVEGYMDVVALAQHGVENAVATLGTATTPNHVQKLLRMVDEIVYCFDGDAAGRKAAWRALENSLGVLRDDARLKFLFLPDGEDPDTYVRKVGADGFREALGDALSLAEFMVRELTAQAEGDAVEAAAQIVHRAEPLLRQIQAPALALLLRKRIADAAGLSSGEVDGLVGQGASRSDRPRAPAMRQRQPVGSLAALLLSRILRAPALAGQIDPERAAALGDEPAARALLAVIGICAGQSDISVEDLAGQLRDSPHAGACRDAARLTRDLPEDVDLAQEVTALAARLPEATPEPAPTDIAALDPAARAAWLADLRRKKGV